MSFGPGESGRGVSGEFLVTGRSVGLSVLCRLSEGRWTGIPGSSPRIPGEGTVHALEGGHSRSFSLARLAGDAVALLMFPVGSASEN